VHVCMCACVHLSVNINYSPQTTT